MIQYPDTLETLDEQYEEETPQLTVSVVRNEEIFALLRDEWRALTDASAVTVYQSFDWLFPWWKHFGTHKTRTLHLIQFRHKNTLVGVAPFFMEAASIAGFPIHRRLRLLGCGVAHKGSRGMFTRYAPTDYLDIIGLPAYETEVARSLTAYLKGSSTLYDEIEFTETPQEGFVVRVLLPEFERRGIPFTKSPLDICPWIRVPSDLDEFVRGCSKRLRRYIPKVRTGFPDAAIEDLQSARALPGVFQELVRMHQKRWNRAGFPGLFTSKKYKAFQEEVLDRFMTRGLLWCKMVRVEDRYIAANLGFRFKDRIYGYLTGFDPDSRYARQRPALALQLNIVEDAIRDGVRVVDLLRGNETYKLEMTSETSRNWEIVVPNTATHRTIRVRLSRFLRVWHSIVQRVQNEMLIVEVHYKEHGIPSFLSRYVAFRGRRVFGDGWKGTSIPSAWRQSLERLLRSIPRAIRR